MTMNQTKVDEVIILGPRRGVAPGTKVKPEDEYRYRDEVARFAVGKGQDFDPPAFVAQGLALSGWMSVRQPVEYETRDYTQVEPSTLTPEVEANPAVVAAEKKAEKAEGKAEPKKASRRSDK